MPGQESKSDIDVVKPIALDEAADSDRGSSFLELSHIQTEAMAGIHRDRAVGNVGLGVLNRSHALVADEPPPIRVIHEFDDERGVARRNPAESQPIGLEDVRSRPFLHVMRTSHSGRR